MVIVLGFSFLRWSECYLCLGMTLTALDPLIFEVGPLGSRALKFEPSRCPVDVRWIGTFLKHVINRSVLNIVLKSLYLVRGKEIEQPHPSFHGLTALCILFLT